MDEQETTGPVIIKGMAPLLQVFDMPASLNFYRDLLGFTIMSSSGAGDNVDWVLLKLNETELMLNTAYEKHERPIAPAPIRTASHTDITLYFSCPEIEHTYTYFQNKGIKLKKPFITGYGWKAINLVDPDGYGICFHWPAEEK